VQEQPKKKNALQRAVLEVEQRQYLYFSTSKTSKLRSCERRMRPYNLQSWHAAPQASVYALLYQ
jgi:hypothetical protein